MVAQSPLAAEAMIGPRFGSWRMTLTFIAIYAGASLYAISLFEGWIDPPRHFVTFTDRLE